MTANDHDRAEQPVHYRKSSFSGQNGHCVEVAGLPDGSRLVRNSRKPDQAAHHFTPEEWSAFVRGVKHGEFD